MKRRDFLHAAGGLVSGASIGTLATITYNWVNTPLVLSGDIEPVEAAAEHTSARLPTGAKVLIFGDSIFAANTFAEQGSEYFALAHHASGEVVWAYMSDPRFRFDVWEQSWDRKLGRIFWDGFNMGVGGTRSNRLESESELEHLRVLDPDIVIVGFGANDIASSTPADAFNERLTSFCDLMINTEGRRVIVALVRPHMLDVLENAAYSYPEGDPKWDVHFGINNYISDELAQRYPAGMFAVWDTFSPLAAPQSYENALFDPRFTTDGVHLNDVGAFQTAANLRAVLDQMIEPGTHFNADPAQENLLLNWRMSNAADRTEEGVSGQTPENWRITRRRGETAELQVTTSTDEDGSIQQMVLDFSFSDDTEVNEFAINFYSGAFQEEAGISSAFLQLFVPLEVESYTNFVYITSFLADDKYSRFSEGLRFQSRTEVNWHGEAFNGWIITPPLEMPEGSLGFRAGLVIRVKGGGEGQPRVVLRPGAIARRIDDPRPEQWRV